MKNIQLYDVAPSIPENLQFLEELARNLWWCWNADAIELFRRINPKLWQESGLNPLQLLRSVSQERLESLSEDAGFLKQLNDVKVRFADEAVHATDRKDGICYFSLEYGLHESVRLYSGGLGVLAGDHLKAASDMGLPLVAVGLLYHQGYFQQYLDNKAMQQELYPQSQIRLLPLVEQNGSDGSPLQISVPLPEGELKAVVWNLKVGRVNLYLLDTRIAANPPEFRDITAKLYGGDKLMRLRQELLLGIGGIRALTAMGYDPAVCHINEGHAAFMSMGRMAHLMNSRGMDIDTAREVVIRTNVFTTHTPVPAGNETFDVRLLKPHLEVLESELGISSDTVISWTRPSVANSSDYEPSMTVLGLRMSQYCNGVSKLHGEVSRGMWSHLWPNYPEGEIPIDHITNGVHLSSWLSPGNGEMFDRYVGPRWRKHPGDADLLDMIDQLPDDELWRIHESCKARMIKMVRDKVASQLKMRNATGREIRESSSVLGNGVLTIGFARRFATYKRATMLLSDKKRLEKLLSDTKRPLQLVFAGKAHPADEYGKSFIQDIVKFARESGNGHKVVFVENYDIHIARRLVQGVDVWLNTPRRPQEASGTSGMKAAMNGVLNASILDGWWEEGYSQDCGWAIGTNDDYQDDDYQDMVDSQALYNLLENDIIPCFYDGPKDGTPVQWVQKMKESMKMAIGFFTSHRMVAEYNMKFYVPAMDNYKLLLDNGAAKGIELANMRKHLKATWPKISIGHPQVDKDVSMLHVGDKFTITAEVNLGDLTPDEVSVEVYHGNVSSDNLIAHSMSDVMSVAEKHDNNQYLYSYTVTCKASGRYGFTVKVVPVGDDWKHVMPGFITWPTGK